MLDLSETPHAIDHPISMDDINATINVLDGNFILETKDRKYTIKGKVSYRWFPRPGLILKAVYDPLPSDYQNVYEIGEELQLLVNEKPFGNCGVKQLSHGTDGVMSVVAG